MALYKYQMCLFAFVLGTLHFLHLGTGQPCSDISRYDLINCMHRLYIRIAQVATCNISLLETSFGIWRYFHMSFLYWHTSLGPLEFVILYLSGICIRRAIGDNPDDYPKVRLPCYTWRGMSLLNCYLSHMRVWLGVSRDTGLESSKYYSYLQTFAVA